MYNNRDYGVFELCIPKKKKILFRIPGDGQIPKTQ
jgi:hypothetical protein